MSVLVRGMEMPTKCVSCDLRAFNGIMDECRATRRKMCGFEYQKGFPDWCPLVEVKSPHGRLIDADRMAVEANEAFISAQIKVKNHLALMINEATHKKVQMMLAYTPSVIEAEEAKDRLE